MRVVSHSIDGLCASLSPESSAQRRVFMVVQVISFDVKPANVLLDRSMRHAKLADVGLAKVLERSMTMTVMVCTLRGHLTDASRHEYSAPEKGMYWCSLTSCTNLHLAYGSSVWKFTA